MLLRPLLQPVLGPLLRSPFEVTGGFNAWALRSFVTANYNQPNPHNQGAMSSPPTVTTYDNDQPPGLTQEFRPANSTDALVTYTGGRKKLLAAAYARFPASTEYIGGTGGTVGDGETQTVFRASVIATAAKVSFSMLDNEAVYRFIVGSQYVSLAGTPIAGTSGRVYYELDFGSVARRVVSVEGILSQGFERVGLPAAAIPIERVSPPKRMIVVGDSFVWGAGATLNSDGLATVAGDMLGISDTWQSGAGGTGYINTSGGTKYNLQQRLQDINSYGPWDAIVVAIGLNDIGQTAGAITTAVETCLASIRSANPAAPVFVVGPWDVNAPGAVVANYAVTKAAIQAGIHIAGCWFLDPQGVTYTKSDASHPDTAGHKTLGDWLALAIKTAIGA